MSISVVCNECGKRLKVPDDRLGKKAKCPQCSATFVVTEGGVGAPAASTFAPPLSKNVRESSGATPRLHISGGLIMFVAVLAVIAGIAAFFYFGPVRARHQWEATEPRAEADVTDVVQRGLESYLSRSGMDLSKAHTLPQVRQVDFITTMAAISMPKRVGFHGTTTQGDFKGVYDIDTGEVEAECEVGGVTFAGLSSAYKHGDKTFQVTGRKKNGQLTAEVDGKNAVVIYPEKSKD